MQPRLMLREDPEISAMVMQKFRSEGIDVLVGHKAERVEIDNGEKILVVSGEGGAARIAFDELLCAVGRVANTAGYGLEELGIPATAAHTVETNDYLQTIYPNIFAAGDVAGPYQFTHTAAHMAWYAAVNGLFGRFKSFKVDYSVVPWATFTDPEVARVGINEQEAMERNIAYEITKYDIGDLDRAIADEDAHGMVKVLTAPGSDRILGACIVGAHAGDLLAEFVLAMKNGLGLNKILGTIHTYPTLAEANKYAAGAWKRAHVTQGQIDFLAALHDYERNDASMAHVIGRVSALFRDKRRAYAPGTR
jgi:pyruvate/2-oxoglutarate dehydrogenase complex dihydrolipoamide dehydrogenase (E3) component